MNIQLLNAIRKNDQSCELDLHDEQKFNLLCDAYGGIEKIKAELPAFYAALEKTRNADFAPMQQKGDFVNDIDIEAYGYNKTTKELIINAVTSLNNKALCLDEIINVRDQNDQPMAAAYDFKCDVNHDILTLKKVIDLDNNEIEQVKIDYFVSFVADEGYVRTILASKDVSTKMITNDQIKQVALQSPIKKNGTLLSPVNIAYNRSFIGNNDVDYYYQEKFSKVTGKQALYAPLSAKIVFKENVAKYLAIDETSFVLKMDCQNGTAKYTKDNRDIQSFFKPTDNGFELTINDDWQEDVPVGRWPIRDRVDLYFSIKYKCVDGNEGLLQIGSNLPEGLNDPAIVQCPYLNLIWGCLSADTKILLANGTDELPIKECRIGELIKGDGMWLRVANVIKGFEVNDMINIETSQNRILTCTSEHPIFTNKGVVKARDITGDMKLYDANNQEVSITGIWNSPGEEIYSIVAIRDDAKQDGNFFYAQGVKVGDYAIQGRMNMRKNTLIASENPFIKELEAKRNLMR